VRCLSGRPSYFRWAARFELPGAHRFAARARAPTERRSRCRDGQPLSFSASSACGVSARFRLQIRVIPRCEQSFGIPQATLLVADIDPAQAELVAARVGGSPLAVDDVYETKCDVYAPCAVGGTLSVETVRRLRCRIVSGSANNQLADPVAAELLLKRGSSTRRTSSSTPAARSRSSAWSSSAGAGRSWTALAGIGATLGQVYERADEQGISTEAAAEVLVDQRLAAARDQRAP
jgi:hypothetical protein